jgi:hypothetical protein
MSKESRYCKKSEERKIKDEIDFSRRETRAEPQMITQDYP